MTLEGGFGSPLFFMRCAFYDFSVAPYSYDIAQFLTVAKSYECEHVVFVPGYREYQKLPKMEQRKRFLKILIPLVEMKGMSYTVCKTREQAKRYWSKDCYPVGYSVDSPNEGHLLRHVVNRPLITEFTPSEDAREYVKQKLNGSKPVVITVRQTQRVERNSNIPEWIKFAEYLKAKGFDVVFIPDTENLDFDFGFPSWKEAEDVHIRTALYESAYVNLGVNNGPMGLLFVSGLPLIYTKPITREHVATTSDFWSGMGIPEGSQPSWFNDNQRLFWVDDSFENLKTAFELWSEVQNGGDWPESPIPRIPMVSAGSDEIRNDQIRVALSKGFPRLKPSETSKEETISIVCYGPSLKDTWKEITRPILTVSGAHDFLIERGVIPDYHLDSDPREHKAKFTEKPHKDVHYLMASCCHPKIWEQLERHQVTLWHALNSKATIEFVLKHDPDSVLVTGGSTAGLRSMEVAGLMGFKKFKIFGMDSSKGESLHAGEHNGKAQREITIRCGARRFVTTPQLIEAAREFLAYVSERPIQSLKLYGDGLLQEMYFQSATQLLEEKQCA